MTKPEDATHAGGAPFERRVGRLLPERDDFYYDDASEPDDGAWCDRCNGDGMDPDCDYLLPCPACQGEQR
jgi:hypothetical protein